MAYLHQSKKQMKMNVLPYFYASKKELSIPMSGTKKWLKRLEETMHHLSLKSSFNNESLAEELGISERDLFRKVKKATGLSPQKYIRQFRLRLAMRYLISGKYRTVKETAHAIGYTKVSYFITQFEKEYGRTPLKVLQENGWR